MPHSRASARQRAVAAERRPPRDGAGERDDGALRLAACEAARLTEGLVDPTLTGEIEAAGYAPTCRRRRRARSTLRAALDGPRREPPAGRGPTPPGGPSALDLESKAVTRPPGIRLDSGGIAKGLFADLLAARWASTRAWPSTAAATCASGAAVGLARAVEVYKSVRGGHAARVRARGGGVATSGIGRRSWIDAEGRPAHHLLDPATGRPAFTGVVQVTALAQSAVEAEARTKAALLSGPERARRVASPRRRHRLRRRAPRDVEPGADISALAESRAAKRTRSWEGLRRLSGISQAAGPTMTA